MSNPASTTLFVIRKASECDPLTPRLHSVLQHLEPTAEVDSYGIDTRELAEQMGIAVSSASILLSSLKDRGHVNSSKQPDLSVRWRITIIGRKALR